MKADEQQGYTIDAQGNYLTPIDIFIEASIKEFSQWFTASYPAVRLKIKSKDSFELVFINSLAFGGELAIKPENNGIRILGIVKTKTNNDWGVIFAHQCAEYFKTEPPKKKKTRAEEIIDGLPDRDKQLATGIMNRYLVRRDYKMIADPMDLSASTVYRWLVKLELVKSRKKKSEP